MPLSTRILGQSTEPVVHDVDDRWLMAYAASIGDRNPRYMDTANAEIFAHPVFPVCVEWPAVTAGRRLDGFETLTPEEAVRGVHAAHDLHLLQPIRPGVRVETRAKVVGVEAIAPGASQWVQLETRDAATGRLLVRTYQQAIYRDVAISGEPGREGALPDPPTRAGGSTARQQSFRLPVREGAAHVYTECARIWNPIHTDRRVALAGRLPDIILHGTATLAMAVSALVDGYLDGDPGPVRRLGGRFAAMVLMPCELEVVVSEVREGAIFFDVLTANGAPAFRHGYLIHGQ